MNGDTGMAGDAEAAGAAAGMAEVYGDGVTVGSRLWRWWCGWEWSPPSQKVRGFPTAINEWVVVARIDERQVACRAWWDSASTGHLCILSLDDPAIYRSESDAIAGLGAELAARAETLRVQWSEIASRVGTAVLDAGSASATVTGSEP
jgi:hypothetical protein